MNLFKETELLSVQFFIYRRSTYIDMDGKIFFEVYVNCSVPVVV